jgi:protein-disulfide isomerase
MQNQLQTRVCFAFIAALIIVPCSLAQESGFELKREIEELKQGQQAIRKDIQELKAILTQKTAAPATPEVNVKGAELYLGNNPIRGGGDSGVTMIDITDYQCPYCGRYARETFPDIMKQYVDNGKIRYVVLDQPLPMHKMAAKAAEASHCANEQGKYWGMHDIMMSKQDSLNNLSLLAGSLNLDVARFDDCMNTNRYAEEVSKSANQVMKMGITGVPGFIIAASDPQNPQRAKGIVFIRGAQPLGNFKMELDKALMAVQSQKGY